MIKTKLRLKLCILNQILEILHVQFTWTNSGYTYVQIHGKLNTSINIYIYKVLHAVKAYDDKLGINNILSLESLVSNEPHLKHCTLTLSYISK